MNKIALGIFAHPDDAEFGCAGTLSLLRKSGWSNYIVTLAPGDKGTAEYNREEISRIRKEEATNAAALLDAKYLCLEFEDLYILYDRKSINIVTSLIRKIQPAIVFTSPPSDYMVDHEITSLIVQTACFSAGIKNMEISEKILGYIPHLYYCDPMEGKDKFGNMVQPKIYVDITTEIELKGKMLACHESQRNWLQKHHKMDKYLLVMEQFARIRGSEINSKFAEGFYQHLGHGFPQTNKLGEILFGAVKDKGSVTVQNKST
jgi:LmbE family N-acetylglucosaminyl deacetylase